MADGASAPRLCDDPGQRMDHALAQTADEPPSFFGGGLFFGCVGFGELVLTWPEAAVAFQAGFGA